MANYMVYFRINHPNLMSICPTVHFKHGSVKHLRSATKMTGNISVCAVSAVESYLKETVRMPFATNRH